MIGCNDDANRPPDERLRAEAATLSTPFSGAAALARVFGPTAILLTVAGGGHTAFGRSSCVAEHVTLYLVEVRVPGGQAC
ncbi:MAG: alpha/beta hydrolase [Micromonosporaceae bacterium]